MGYIIKPLVTEKMTAITEKQNKFGFIVRPEANKLEIRKEVEALYNVTVVAVNTADMQVNPRAVTPSLVLFRVVQMLTKRLL